MQNEANQKLAIIERMMHDADGSEIISLDRLRELAEAEREGRAVVLPPLKVGDSAWILRMTAGGYLKPICGTVSELFLIREKKVVVVVSHIGRGHYGERIFKTRAEAERALAATEPKGDAT